MAECGGRLYGVGVGPGDPELLTVKAARLLREVSVVFIPKRSLGDEGYAFSIVRDLLDPVRQELVPLAFPMTRDFASLEPIWDGHADAIAARLASGAEGAFITEGDPFFFSTFIYIWERLRARHPGVRVEVIPGVSSVHAAACRAGLPLADGDDRVAILPAAYETDGIRAALAAFDTVVFMKCSGALPRLIAELERAGLEERAVYVRRATTGAEEVVRDLRTLLDRPADYLSLIIVRRGGTPAPAGAGGRGR